MKKVVESTVFEAYGRIESSNLMKVNYYGGMKMNVIVLDENYPVYRKELELGYWCWKEYREYDGHRLVEWMEKLVRECSWSMIEKSVKGAVKDPNVYSYRMAANLPLSNEQRYELLKVNCIQRLRLLVPILKNATNIVACKECDHSISERRYMVQHVQDNVLVQTHVNPGGFVHQLIAYAQVAMDSITLDENPPCLEGSWFPTHAWTIVYCKQCNHHLGWQFDAVQQGRLPARFWGFRRETTGLLYQ